MAVPKWPSPGMSSALNYSFPGLKYQRIHMRDSYDVRFWWSLCELIAAPRWPPPGMSSAVRGLFLLCQAFDSES